MMTQTTSIIAEALLYSLLAGAATYIALRLVLALLKNIPALIKYHLCNISLLIPLLIFTVSLTKLTTIKDTAPVYPTPPPIATTYNYIQPAASLVLQEPAARDEKLTAEMLWVEVHSVINDNSLAITWLYIAGLLLFSVRLLLLYRQSQQLKTKGVLPATDDWHRLLANTMQRLNISRSIHIAFTERKISPCIIGHAKAVILVPISLANHLTTEQAEAILLHELAHYKQYDHYINLGVQCIKCILFFNPFTWLSAILIDKYRELSCDETATRHERNIELAETLALIAGMQARQNSLVMSLKKRSPLLSRVQALLHTRQYDKSSHRLLPLLATTIVLATGLLIAGSTKLFSTEKDNLREQLKDISAQMYKEGNHKYIFVDAVLDSLVTLPAKVEILYMGNNNLFVGANKLDGNIKYRYAQKLKQFLVQQGEDGEHVTNIAPMPDKKRLTLAHIINPSSDFRKCTAYERYNANITTRAWRQVFGELYNDKLIHSIADRFEMRYSKKGIIIDRDTLRGEQDVKYRKLFKDVVGINLDDNSVSGRLTIGDLKKYLLGNITQDEKDTVDKQYKERNVMLTHLFNELQKDGLADTNHRTEIEYRNGQVFLNLVQLETEAQGKYTGLLQKVISYSAKTDTHSTYTWYIEKPFPQYYYERLDSLTEKERLAAISEELYQTGYQGYIIADAVLDGYIKDGEYYKANYKKDGFFIEGVILPIEVKKRYDDKMEAFIAMHKDVKRISWSISDTFEARKGIKEFRYRITNGEGEAEEQTSKKTFKTSSVTLASGPFRVYKSKGSESQMKSLVQSMHKDKLLDSNSYYVIDYRQSGVYVNARKLTGSNVSKYNAMLQAMGDNPGSGPLVEHVPQGVKIPDFYSGDTKIEINTSGTNLPAIAQLMFVDGNPNFILAHALHDGVLRERQNFNFQFTGGKTYFNGKLLPAPYQSKYTKMMDDFMSAHKRQSKSFSMRGDGVTKKELNTPEAAIRKERINKGRNQKGEYYVDRVIRMMAADGLIDTTRKHTMTYNARGIFVNGEKLSDEEAAKYEAILKEGYGRSPRWTASDGISYSNEP